MNASLSGIDVLATRQVTLVAPGLFKPASAEGVTHATLLMRLLARADHEPQPVTGFEARLFDLFGVIPEVGRDLPVAAVTRLADMGVVDNDWWIRADPVHLEPRRDSLILRAIPELIASEADCLAAELNESLTLDGWLLRAPHPQRWYLKPPAAGEIVTTALAEAMGRDIAPFLPRGPDHKAWHTRLNEIQILLHTSPVNAEREAQGRLPANSVWFWGGGRLPRLGETRWSRVWADDPLSLGLARLAGVPAQPLPSSIEHGWPPDEGRQLIVITGLGADHEAVRKMARTWLEPLSAAVHRGDLNSLELVSDSGPRFRYRRHHRLRVWRRRRPLHTWLEVA